MHSLHVTCRPEEVDGLSGDLWEWGTEGLQEVDRGEKVELVAGFADAARGPELLARFAEYSPEWERQPETDWIAYTRELWPPREVGSELFLAAPWFSGETPLGRVRITHNPGGASGTGEHPCTQLMLEALELCIRGGERVLDVGTGSGILAIAALRLGAVQAYGIDTDAEALQTAKENFALNDLPARLAAGSVDGVREGCADLVAANISGTVLLSLFDDLLRAAKPGGWMVLSGFTEGELAPFLQLLPGCQVTSRNEWRCVYGQLSWESWPQAPA